MNNAETSPLRWRAWASGAGRYLFCFLFEVKGAIFLGATEKGAGEEESASESLKRR